MTLSFGKIVPTAHARPSIFKTAWYTNPAKKISKYYKNLYLTDDENGEQKYEMSRNDILKKYSQQDQAIHKALTYPIEGRKYSETEKFELEDELRILK